MEDAFKAYLAKLAGVPTPGGSQIKILDRQTKVDTILKLFESKNLSVAKPTTISVPLTFQEGQVTYQSETDFANVEKTINSFIDKWLKEDTKRVLMWDDGEKVNFGVATIIEGITEVHYVSVEVGK